MSIGRRLTSGLLTDRELHATMASLLDSGREGHLFPAWGEEMEYAIGILPCRTADASAAEDSLRPAVGEESDNCRLDGMR